MKDVHCECRAVVAPGRPVRDESAARVDADHDADDCQREGVDVHLMSPVDESEDRARRDHERGDDEDRRLGESGEVLGLSVPVRMADVGRAAGDPDREEGQEGGDEIRSRMRRL